MSLLPSQLKLVQGLIESLKNELASIKESVHRSSNGISTISDQQKAQHETWKEIAKYVSILPARENERAADEANQERRHGENTRHQIWIGWATWVTAVSTTLAFGAAGYYAFEAHNQLAEMRNASEISIEALNEARNALQTAQSQFDRTMQQTIPQTSAQIQSSKAARDAVKFARDSFRQDQRPWLSIKDITCGTCETIGGSPHGGNAIYDWITTIRNLRTEVVNTGKTPAGDVQVDCNVHIGGVSYNLSKCATTPEGCSRFQFDSRNLKNFQDRGPADTFPVPHMDIGSIAPTQEKSVILNPTEPAHTIGLTRDSEASVYVEGTISYHSAWGSTGETKFCFFPKFSRGLTTNKEPANKEPANDNYCDNPGSNTMR